MICERCKEREAAWLSADGWMCDQCEKLRRLDVLFPEDDTDQHPGGQSDSTEYD